MATGIPTARAVSAVADRAAGTTDRVLGAAAGAFGFEVADPVFELPAEVLGFEFATPVVFDEFADGELSSDESAAAAGLLASATPNPSATVAAAAREVSIAGFMESSDVAVTALDYSRQPQIYQVEWTIFEFKLSVKPIMVGRSTRGRSPITLRHNVTHDRLGRRFSL